MSSSCAVVLWVVGATATSAAEPPPAEDATRPSENELARRARDRAFKLLQEDRYPEAIEQLEAAYAAVPNPGFLLNIAIAHQKVGACGPALATLERFRSVCADDCPFAEEGRSKGSEIERSCRVRLRVESQPPGLSVRIDGVPQGRTPLLLERGPGAISVTTSSSTLRLDLKGGEDAWLQTVLQTQPPPPPRNGRAFRRGLGWGFVGLGGTGLILGSTFTALAVGSAQDRDAALEGGAPPGEVDALGARAERETAVAVVGLSLAALSAVTTLVLWTMDPEPAPPAP